MSRRFRQALLGSGALPLLLSTAVFAGGGDYCPPNLQLDYAALHCDQRGMAFLGPANDTRINLLLIGLDRLGAEPAAADTPGALFYNIQGPMLGANLHGESYQAEEQRRRAALVRLRHSATEAGAHPGNLNEAERRLGGWLPGRCELNSTAPAAAFIDAVNQDETLSTQQRITLANTRLQIAGDCDKAVQVFTLRFIDAPDAYRQYLQGIVEFYQGDLDAAVDTFATLTSDNVWLSEAARYMHARTLLNKAQAPALQNWYFEPGKIDLESLAAAKAGFSDYLAQYPEGRYADSAAQLFRRLDWLAGDHVALGDHYAQLFEQVDETQLLTAVLEIDLRYLRDASPSSALSQPDFTLIRQLQLMRTPDYGAVPVLENPEAVYREEQAVWAHLADIAYHLYQRGDDKYVIAQVPAADTGPLNLNDFSLQVWRGIALIRQGDWPAATAHWQQLIGLTEQAPRRAVAELGLAVTLERSGQLSAMFAPDSPITTRQLREPVITHVAPAEVLRQIVDHSTEDNEREWALARLLREQLARGQYEGFLADLPLQKKVPMRDLRLSALVTQPPGATDPDYPCLATPELANRLAQDPQQPHLLNCLGNVLKHVDAEHSTLDGKPHGLQPGGGADQFTGQPRTPLSLYRAVIADPHTAGHDERAYALMHAINCYRRGVNRCGHEMVDSSERARWFRELKNNHGSTTWAKAQQYYW